MYHLIYISTAVNLMSQDKLAELLTQSRKNNKALNITGMLFYAEGTFLQALEGDETAVNKIYAIIENDNRHKNVVTIISGESDVRVFPNWSMAFSAVNPEQMNKLEGYIDPLNKELFKGDNNNTAITILKTFAETNKLIIT